jgi:hypothetical protein
VTSTSISIEIDGVQHGWANATVRAGDKSYRMQGFSYNTNAFDALLRFGVDAALDAYKTEAVFDGEPGGWGWRFERLWAPGTGPVSKLCIDELEDASVVSTPRHEAFVLDVSADDLAHAIRDAVASVESSMGIDAFERAWGQAFPVRCMAALTAALSIERRADPDRGPVVAAVSVRGDDE